MRCLGAAAATALALWMTACGSRQGPGPAPTPIRSFAEPGPCQPTVEVEEVRAEPGEDPEVVVVSVHAQVIQRRTIRDHQVYDSGHGEWEDTSSRVEECSREPFANAEIRLQAERGEVGQFQTDDQGEVTQELRPDVAPEGARWLVQGHSQAASASLVSTLRAAAERRWRRLEEARFAEEQRLREERALQEQRDGRCHPESIEALSPVVRSISERTRQDWVIETLGVVVNVDHEFIVASGTTRIRPSLPGEYTVIVRSRSRVGLEVRDPRGAVVGQQSNVGDLLTDQFSVGGDVTHRTFMANGRDRYDVQVQGSGCAVLVLVHRP